MSDEIINALSNCPIKLVQERIKDNQEWYEVYLPIILGEPSE